MNSVLGEASVSRSPTLPPYKKNLSQVYIREKHFNNEPYAEDTVQISTISHEEARSLLPKPGLPEFAFRSMFFTSWATLAFSFWILYTVLHMKDLNGAHIISYKKSLTRYLFFCLGFVIGGRFGFGIQSLSLSLSPQEMNE
jgi:hypothetical protein